MGKIYSKKCIKCMMNRKSTKYEYFNPMKKKDVTLSNG